MAKKKRVVSTRVTTRISVKHHEKLEEVRGRLEMSQREMFEQFIEFAAWAQGVPMDKDGNDSV